MLILYCTNCRFVANMDREPRMSLTVSCNCHSELQKLAARAPGGSWHLADRAAWVTIPEEVFAGANE